MYLRTTKRKNRDGTEVAYYQLAESVWNAEKRRSEAKILYSFGRADGVDRAQLLRLADSIRRACGASSEAGPTAHISGIPCAVARISVPGPDRTSRT